MLNKVVTFGEIMLRLCTPGFERFQQARKFDATYGGGEANVAASLADFGMDVEFVTRLPNNDIGEACQAFLRQKNIGTQHIVFGGERIGIYFLEAGAAQRPSKVLYDRAGSSFATLQKGSVNWEEAFAGANWFHWTGITPAVSQSAAEVCKEGIEAAHKLGMTISCDLNYRAKLWKWTDAPGKVMEDLVSQSDIAIGNEEDAEKVFGIKAHESNITRGKLDPQNYLRVCEQLATKMGNLKTIAFTLRGSLSASHNTWSGVLWQDRKFIMGTQYDVFPIVDRVGSGDAFAAGLIYGLLNFTNDQERALQFAIAASCLKHTIQGDFNSIHVAEVEQLMKGDQSGRISR